MNMLKDTDKKDTKRTKTVRKNTADSSTKSAKSGKLIARITHDEEPLSPVNQYKARAVKTGKRIFAQMYMDKKFSDYKERFKNSASVQYTGDPVDGPVFVKAWLYMGTRRRKDLPNAGKLEFDALSGIIYHDDSQICKLETEKIYRKGEPGLIIEVYTFPEAQWD